MKTLQELLGDAVYSTTADTYSHVTKNMKKRSSNYINKALKESNQATNGDVMATSGKQTYKKPLT